MLRGRVVLKRWDKWKKGYIECAGFEIWNLPKDRPLARWKGNIYATHYITIVVAECQARHPSLPHMHYRVLVSTQQVTSGSLLLKPYQ